LPELKRLEGKKVRLAVLYAAAGIGSLVVLALFQEFPPLSVWIPFAAAFAFLEWRSVEVNERLKASPSVMVALVAGVVFGRGSAALGMAALGALGMLNQRDIRERRVLVPIMNFGQYVVTETVTETVMAGSAALVDSALKENMGDAPVCSNCGHMTIRNGSCYVCLTCGDTTGCS